MRGQKAAACLSQIRAETPRAGCKKGQAHPHTSSSASSPLLAVPARGLPGPEAVFVLVFYSSPWSFLPQIGLSFPVVFLAPVASDGNGSHSVHCEKVCVCVLTYFLLSPRLAEWETKEKHPPFCLFPTTQAVTLSHSNYSCCVLCKPRASHLLRANFTPFA